MNKIRIGLFETNSSSTHSCVICKESDYSKWDNGEYAYIVSPSIFESLEDDYEIKDAIHGNFIEVDSLKRIPLSALFDFSFEKTNEDVKKECENFSFYDVYNLLLNTSEDNWKDSWESYCDDPVYYDDEDEKVVKLVDCIKSIYYDSEEFTNQVLFDVVYEMGLCNTSKISNGWSTQQYIDREDIDGMEIVSISEYGCD